MYELVESKWILIYNCHTIRNRDNDELVSEKSIWFNIALRSLERIARLRFWRLFLTISMSTSLFVSK